MPGNGFVRSAFFRQNRHIIPACRMDLLQCPFQKPCRLHLKSRVVGYLDGIVSCLHLLIERFHRTDFPGKTGTDAAVLHRLMGITAAHHGNLQFFPQGAGETLRPFPVLCHILSVEIHKVKTAKLILLLHLIQFPINLFAR